MIKKVLDKKNETITKFPEYDSSKIYVRNLVGIDRLTRDAGDTFRWVGIDNDFISSYTNSFISECQDGDVYIVDKYDGLARFLSGCREFPKVEETVVRAVLEEDEVSIDDVTSDKIYAFSKEGIFGGSDHIYKLQIGYGNEYNGFVALNASSRNYLDPIKSTDVDEHIKYHLNRGRTVYQFDTQEEFLKWSLEQITNKKFRTYSTGARAASISIPCLSKTTLEVLV